MNRIQASRINCGDRVQWDSTDGTVAGRVLVVKSSELRGDILQLLTDKDELLQIPLAELYSSRGWVRQVSPADTYSMCLQSCYHGIPVAIGPWFDGPDCYDGFCERNADLLDEILSRVSERSYIDCIEIRMDSALIHMRSGTGRIVPDYPTVIFEARWFEPKRIQK